jgi:D-lyxose ketol-isomerase
MISSACPLSQLLRWCTTRFLIAPDWHELRVVIDGTLGDLDVAERPAGHKRRLAPGDSVTLMPHEHWHAFWAEGSDVFVGEVSTVNDDNTDNVFEDPAVSRFGGIEEDEEPWRLLVSD